MWERPTAIERGEERSRHGRGEGGGDCLVPGPARLSAGLQVSVMEPINPGETDRGADRADSHVRMLHPNAQRRVDKTEDKHKLTQRNMVIQGHQPWNNTGEGRTSRNTQKDETLRWKQEGKHYSTGTSRCNTHTHTIMGRNSKTFFFGSWHYKPRA